MNKTSNQRRINELEQLRFNLKEKYNQSNLFRRLYESANRNNKSDNEMENHILISNGENDTIFNELSDDIIDILIDEGKYDRDIFCNNKKTISESLFHDMIDTISCLLNILEYSLTKTLIKNKYNRTNQPPIRH